MPQICDTRTCRQLSHQRRSGIVIYPPRHGSSVTFLRSFPTKEATPHSIRVFLPTLTCHDHVDLRETQHHHRGGKNPARASRDREQGFWPRINHLYLAWLWDLQRASEASPDLWPAWVWTGSPRNTDIRGRTSGNIVRVVSARFLGMAERFVAHCEETEIERERCFSCRGGVY